MANINTDSARDEARGHDEAGLIDVFSWLARHFWRLALLGVFASVAAFFAGRSLPREYTATTRMIAAQGPQPGSSGLAALAGLAGVSANGGGEEQIGLVFLRSRFFLDRFIRESGIAPELLPRRHLGRIPTAKQREDAFNALRKRLTVTQDKASGVVDIELRLREPRLAAAYLNDITDRLNRELRTRAIRRAGASRRFLENELSHTQNAEMQRTIATMTAGELKTLMVARQPSGYGFEILDPAIPPVTSSNIRPLFLAVGGLLLGILIGIIWAYFHDAMAVRRRFK